MNYLSATKKLTNEFKARGQQTLTAGYQYVLSKKLSGNNYGAYSEWHNSKPDLFTTSWVVKFLSNTKQWVEIDERHITDALNYLKTKQNPETGEFTGEVENQVAEKSNEDLTADVAISLLENNKYVNKYKSVIDKSLKYLNDQFDSINDSYGLAISAYALALGKHDGAQKFLGKLMERAQNTSDTTSWVQGSQTPSSNDIKTAAYSILALMRLEKSADARNIIAWLISQRNRQGGFLSTEDTVIGIQAMTEAAKRRYSGNFDMDVYFTYDEPNKFINVHIDNGNANVLRKEIVPSSDGVSVNGNGTGVAYVQVWWNFYEKDPRNVSNDYKIKLSNRKLSDESLNLEFCVKYEGQGSPSLSVAEINLPSGYEVDEDLSNDLKRNGVKVTKTKKKLY